MFSKFYTIPWHPRDSPLAPQGASMHSLESAEQQLSCLPPFAEEKASGCSNHTVCSFECMSHWNGKEEKSANNCLWTLIMSETRNPISRLFHPPQAQFFQAYHLPSLPYISQASRASTVVLLPPPLALLHLPYTLVFSPCSPAISCSQVLADLGLPPVPIQPRLGSLLPLAPQPILHTDFSGLTPILILSRLHVHLPHPFGHELLQGEPTMLSWWLPQTIHSKWHGLSKVLINKEWKEGIKDCLRDHKEDHDMSKIMDEVD